MAALALGLLPELPVIIPLITDVVHMVEGLFGKKPGTGASKKSLALNIIQDGLGAYGAIAPVFGGTSVDSAKISADISAAIDAIVTLYNDMGVFAKPAVKQ